MTIKSIISNDELKKFIAVLKENKNDQVHDVCILMMFTGMRLNEILSLKFEDIDFHSNTMVISKTKERANKNCNVVIQFNDTIKESFLNIKKKFPDSIWVFESRKSNNRSNKEPKSLSRQAITQVFKNVSSSLNCQITMSALRHFYATEFMRAKLSESNSVIDLKKVLGHISSRNTDYYLGKGRKKTESLMYINEMLDRLRE